MISMIEYEKLFKEKKELEASLAKIIIYHPLEWIASKERKIKSETRSIGKNTHIILIKLGLKILFIQSIITFFFG